jgi:hypothetical protein
MVRYRNCVNWVASQNPYRQRGMTLFSNRPS